MGRRYTKWSDKKAGWSKERKAQAAADLERNLRSIELLKTLRTERGMTQVQLAELLELTQGAISSMENRNSVTLENLLRYVDALGGHLTLTVEWPEGGETKLAM